MGLFIFDFDLTITSEHSANAIVNAINIEQQKFGKSQIKQDSDKQWDILKAIKPTGTPEEWKKLFSNLLANGHHLAIASYNTHGATLIPRYLKEVIGLPQEMMDKIYVESWMPATDREIHREGKNTHIKNIKTHYKYADMNAAVVLIDDQEGLLDHAKRIGCSVIRATNFASIIDNINEMLTFINPDMPKSNAFRRFQQSFPEGLTFFNKFATDPAKKISSNQIDLLLFKEFTDKLDQVNDIKNAYLITANFELYYFDEDGKSSQMKIDAAKLGDLFKTMNVDAEVFALFKMPKSISRQITNEKMDEFNKLLLEGMKFGI